MENEIKFRYGTDSDYDSVISAETINDGDVYFTNSTSTSDDTVTAGTIYRGGEIMGTAAADKLILTEDLPLIGQSFGNYSDGDTIPAGTSIYDLLRSALQQEIWPSSQSLSTSTSMTLYCTASPSGNVEVGTVVSSNLYYTYSSTASYSSYPAAGGTSTSNVSVTARALNSISLSRTAPTSAVLSTDLASGSSNVYTDSGVSLSTEGSTLSYSITGVFGTLSDAYTQYSNMGNERTVTNTATSTVSKSGTQNNKATAYYRYYYGSCSLTEDEILALTQSDLSGTGLTNTLLTASATPSVSTIGGETTPTFIVILPESKSWDITESLSGESFKNQFSSTNITYTNGEYTGTYTIYYKIGGDIAIGSFSITK